MRRRPVGAPLTESAHAPTPNRRADVATRRRKLIVGLLRTSSVPGLITSGTRNLRARASLHSKRRHDGELDAFGPPYLGPSPLSLIGTQVHDVNN